MKLATFIYNDSEQPGVYIENKGYYPLSSILGNQAPKTLLEYIQNPVSDLESIIASKNLSPLSRDQVVLKAPIPRPFRDVICLGKNYADHAKEIEETRLMTQGADSIPLDPVYFTKSACPATGDGDVIPLHEHLTSKVDYEVELAVIIGKTAYNISEENVEDFIFGYTILNDISARDVQVKYGQWFFGKSLDGFCSMGPHIITKDEIPFPIELEVSCRVNGETRQTSNTSKLIFGISRIIAEISKGITLFPGDIIATGTPAGVGHALKPPTYLKKGDKVECEIEKLGVLTNYF